MSKRNFTLLIIVLVIILVVVFGFFYFRGTTTTPATPSTGTNFFSPFNPFGNGGTKPPVVTPPVDVSGYTPPPEQVQNTKLQKVSSMPIAGFVVYQKERIKDASVDTTTPAPNTTTDTTSMPTTKNTKTVKAPAPLTEIIPALRYVARATGNIFQTFADKVMERQFSSTVIPKVYDSYFSAKGESVLMRYLKPDGKTIETFIGNLPKELLGANPNPNNDLKGSFLPDNVKDISISPDGINTFYLFLNGDNMIGTTLNLSTSKKAQIFSSPFTEWLSNWPNAKMITLTTKPSAGVPGYMYMIDPTNSKTLPTKVLGNINGLTTLTSPNGKLVLYNDNNLNLNIFHVDTGVTSAIGVKTLPEKCVWGNGNDVIYCSVPRTINLGAYPDNWYQGEISFSDQIWKVDVATGNGNMILDPLAVIGGQDIDGIKLSLDQGENYLFFVNKKDSFLWEFNLK